MVLALAGAGHVWGELGLLRLGEWCHYFQFRTVFYLSSLRYCWGVILPFDTVCLRID